MSNLKTYEQATKRPSRDVWPGCGDGRNRWCGRVHDFSYSTSDGKTVHRFCCHMNYLRGCPQPKPEPGAGA